MLTLDMEANKARDAANVQSARKQIKSVRSA